MGEEDKQAQQPPAPPADDEEFLRKAFEHPRFKDLAKRAKEAEAQLAKVEKERADAEQAKLKEAAQFQTLYEQAQAKAAKLEADLTAIQAERQADTKRAALRAAALAAGFNQQAANDAPLFVDLAQVELDEAGKPLKATVERAIKALAQERAYMLEKRADGGSPATRRPQAPVKPEVRRVTPL